MTKIDLRGMGFLIWRPGSGDTIEIFELEVLGDHRRKGVGRKLVDLLLDNLEPKIHTVYAITRASNRVAQLFYEELRFRSVPLYDFYKDEPLYGRHPYTDALMYIRDVRSQA